MEHNMAYYRWIQGTNGVSSLKEAQTRFWRKDVTKAFQETIDWESVTVNDSDTAQELQVLPGATLTEKKWKAKPGEVVHLGDIITWKAAKWIVDELDPDDKINYQGTIKLCNYILRWQLEDGTIHDEYGYAIDGTKNGAGETYEEYMDTPNFVVKVIVQMNANTLKLRRNKRFLVGAYGTGLNPLCVELSKVNPITGYFSYGAASTQYNKGLLTLTLHESQFNEQTDNAELGVADYVTPGSSQSVEQSSASIQGSGWFG